MKSSFCLYKYMFRVHVQKSIGLADSNRDEGDRDIIKWTSQSCHRCARHRVVKSAAWFLPYLYAWVFGFIHSYYSTDTLPGPNSTHTSRMIRACTGTSNGAALQLYEYDCIVYS